MKTYEQKMYDYLEVEGWQISNIDKSDLEWWADEIWELESTWSPQGVKSFLTFLVDPQHDGVREKGQEVWGIGCSSAYPNSRNDAESGGTIGFGKSFKKDISSFLMKLDALRYVDEKNST
jgi:hypothetical protein